MVSLSLLLSYLGYHSSWSLSHSQVYLSSPWKHRVPSRHLRTKLKHWDSRLGQATGLLYLPSLLLQWDWLQRAPEKKNRPCWAGSLFISSWLLVWKKQKDHNSPWSLRGQPGLVPIERLFYWRTKPFSEDLFCVVWRYHQCWRGKLGKDLDRSMLPCLNRVPWPEHLLNCVDSGKHVQEPSMKYG